jgi:rod shape-determining protein MreB
MIGRTPGSSWLSSRCARALLRILDMTADMLTQLHLPAHQGIYVCQNEGGLFTVPTGVTEVERRAVEDAGARCGYSEVELIEEPMGLLWAQGLPVYDATGSMVVDIGGGTCELR